MASFSLCIVMMAILLCGSALTIVGNSFKHTKGSASSERRVSSVTKHWKNAMLSNVLLLQEYTCSLPGVAEKAWLSCRSWFRTSETLVFESRQPAQSSKIPTFLRLCCGWRSSVSTAHLVNISRPFFASAACAPLPQPKENFNGKAVPFDSGDATVPYILKFGEGGKNDDVGEEERNAVDVSLQACDPHSAHSWK